MADALTLTMAGFLQLAASCGDGIAPQTLADIQHGESRFNTIAININGKNGGTVHGLKSKAQAIEYAKLLYKQGVNFDAGLPQINSKNFEWLGLTPVTVFDECEAMKAQVRYLRGLSIYNTGNKEKGFKNGYVNKIVAGQPTVREAMRKAWDGSAAPVSRETASDDPKPSNRPGACTARVPKWDTGGKMRLAALCAKLERKLKKSKPATTPTKTHVEEYP